MRPTLFPRSKRNPANPRFFLPAIAKNRQALLHSRGSKGFRRVREYFVLPKGKPLSTVARAASPMQRSTLYWIIGGGVVVVGSLVTGLWGFIAGSGTTTASDKTSGMMSQIKDFFTNNTGIVILIAIAAVMLIYSKTKKTVA